MLVSVSLITALGRFEKKNAALQRDSVRKDFHQVPEFKQATAGSFTSTQVECAVIALQARRVCDMSIDAQSQ